MESKEDQDFVPLFEPTAVVAEGVDPVRAAEQRHAFDMMPAVPAIASSEDGDPAVAFMAALTGSRTGEFLLAPTGDSAHVQALLEPVTPRGELWKSLTQYAQRGLVRGRGRGPQGIVFSVCPSHAAADGEDAALREHCISMKVFTPAFAAVARAEIRNLAIVNSKLFELMKVQPKAHIPRELKALVQHEIPPILYTAEWIAEAKLVLQRIPQLVGHDRHASGAVAVGIKPIQQGFYAAPTLDDAVRAGSMQWPDVCRVVTDVLHVLRFLQRLFPGFRHNDASAGNILIDQDRRGVLMNWSLASASNSVLQSPLIPTDITLEACSSGLCAAPSPLADVHRLFATLLVAAQAAKADWQYLLESLVYDVIPEEYFTAAFTSSATHYLSGAGASLLASEPRAARGVEDVLAQRELRRYAADDWVLHPYMQA